MASGWSHCKQHRRYDSTCHNCRLKNRSRIKNFKLIAEPSVLEQPVPLNKELGEAAMKQSLYYLAIAERLQHAAKILLGEA